MASGDFPELVERTRQATNDLREKAKLVLRRLLPGVEAIQRENANFSPRLMRLMLSRAGERLSPHDRDRLHAVLQHAETFQPQLIAWMLQVEKNGASAGSADDVRQCEGALQLTSQHAAELDAVLAKAE